MRLRRLPETPWHEREERDTTPDEFRLRPWLTNWGEQRTTVEAYQRGRLLGDRPFEDNGAALAFANEQAKYYGAKLTEGRPMPLTPPNGRAAPTASAHVPSSDFDPPKCERCGEPFEDKRKHALFHRAMPRKRYCSERCRKQAEAARWYQRRQSQ